MTASLTDILLYAGALLVLFLTPGPVWLALSARTLTGGFAAAWPLALGVVVGDALWPLLAILGVSWVVQEVSWIMEALRYVGLIVFWVMGINLIRHADRTLNVDSRLTRPGALAGFAAGMIVILGNPKAILFYMGILPGFFDLTQVTTKDVIAIVAMSMLVPLVGNLVFAFSIDRVRRLLTSPKALRRTNIIAGCALIFVGCIIPFT